MFANKRLASVVKPVVVVVPCAVHLGVVGHELVEVVVGDLVECGLNFGEIRLCVVLASGEVDGIGVRCIACSTPLTQPDPAVGLLRSYGRKYSGIQIYVLVAEATAESDSKRRSLDGFDC